MMSAVLIETLWNVKIAKVYQIDEKSRINRNIVECKEIHEGINPVTGYVLIETLWNVKGGFVVDHCDLQWY